MGVSRLVNKAFNCDFSHFMLGTYGGDERRLISFLQMRSSSKTTTETSPGTSIPSHVGRGQRWLDYRLQKNAVAASRALLQPIDQLVIGLSRRRVQARLFSPINRDVVHATHAVPTGDSSCSAPRGRRT